MKKIFPPAFFLSPLLVFLSFFLPSSVFASNLYLSPGKGTIPVGETISVQIRLNAGRDAVNGVSAFLTYPADKVDVTYVSPGSTFGIEAEKSFGGGSIRVSRGNINGVTGDVNVATIGLRGKTAGPATLSFVGGSAAPRASDSSDSLTGRSGGTYTVGGAPKPISKNTSEENAGPLIKDIVVSDVATNSATITWQTEVAADSWVEYGPDKDQYFLNTSNPTTVTSHSLKLENLPFPPGSKIHFRLKSTAAGGKSGTSGDNVFQLIGSLVKIKLTDEQGFPLAGRGVWLYSDPLKTLTNSFGEAVFENVIPGKHLLVVKMEGFDQTSEINVTREVTISNITVKNPLPKKSQQSSFSNLSSLPKNFVYAGAGIGILLLVIIIILAVRRRRKNVPTAQPLVPPTPTFPPPPVIQPPVIQPPIQPEPSPYPPAPSPGLPASNPPTTLFNPSPEITPFSSATLPPTPSLTPQAPALPSLAENLSTPVFVPTPPADSTWPLPEQSKKEPEGSSGNPFNPPQNLT